MSTDLHALSGAYAIDALSEPESVSFARHLDDCATCLQEVLELQEAAARMGAAEAVVAPASLKARVLAAADREPQLPPKVVAITKRSRRWSPRMAAAAASVVLAVGVGATVLTVNQGDDAPPVAANPVSQVFQAKDAHVQNFRTSDGRTIKVATSAASGQLAIDTAGLTGLTRDEVYQLWALHNGKATSIGVIGDPGTGKVTPIPTYGTTVAITVEPEGGSQQPTSSPIVEVNPQTV